MRVHATTVNRTDCATRAAKPFLARLMTGLTKPNSTVLGCEIAGVVEEVGDDVDAYRYVETGHKIGNVVVNVEV